MAALALSKGRDRVDTDLPQGFFRRNADFLRFSILRPLAAMLIFCALAGIRQIGLGSDATFSQFSGFHKAAAGQALKELPAAALGGGRSTSAHPLTRKIAKLPVIWTRLSRRLARTHDA